jgi:hypothetical protein
MQVHLAVDGLHFPGIGKVLTLGTYKNPPLEARSWEYPIIRITTVAGDIDSGYRSVVSRWRRDNAHPAVSGP